ncbi:YheC/YheD family endospore coat-associated protein [Paenibacillus radicis (ex Gao et al. 2016)]|uniref:Endospore coat-associated protein YheD n=1 Tax=Paenibacillus radicis (ex Gao et al. 2016) TaxID=1737354 RepID=A0A917HCP4_9BACL|nr:YheC/YheD family protein [Paenibacillus radicis (ex Gao et al. 2016)]GGG74861.1 endospore coat-associated protein YheD [Paenibacillus radicis (ex Gao et al. 2016)]
MESLTAEQESVAEIRAGRPVLAILTIDDELQLFRGNRSNFADLIRTGQQYGFIVYVLTAKNLFLSRSSLKGYVYDEAGEVWHQRLMPFPDIIYNRIPLREDEMQKSVRNKITACTKDPRVKLFNPSFFNKWSLFEWLRQSKTTKPFIPTTRKLMTVSGLGKMMQKHPYIYLKPESGKAGKGIMTIKLQPEKQLPYLLKIQEDRKSATYNCATLGKLWTRIQKQSAGEAYIAQQGIQLASYNDRRFDLRTLVQKNERGKWEVTGIGARLAGFSSITTHVPRGGMIEDPEKLLVSSFNAEQARKILIKTKQTSLMIARQIERGSGQLLGEMSMDLGIDSTGNIWLFEANSKPMKFDEPHIRQKSLERIFQYSSYLTKQKPEKAGGA